MCCVSDLASQQNAEVWRAEQNKRQRFFAFFGNKLAFVLWGFLRNDWFYLASL